MAHYTVETAKVDPLVEKAVAAASAGIRGPLSLLQAKATTVLERATADANCMIAEAAAAASAEMETMMRDAVRNAAVGLAADFHALGEEKEILDIGVADQARYITDGYGPERLARADGMSLCLASSSIINMVREGDGTRYFMQAWDCYGDCLINSRVPPYSCHWGDKKAPAIGLRAKLTPEYQEILWEVAKKMDASFLRPIFDKYHPSAPELERLQVRSRQCIERETAVKVREQKCVELEAQLERTTKEITERARTEAFNALASDYAKHALDIAQLESEKVEFASRIHDLDTKCKEFADMFKAAALRLQAANAKEIEIAAALRKLQPIEEANQELNRVKTAANNLMQDLAAALGTPANVLTKFMSDVQALEEAVDP